VHTYLQKLKNVYQFEACNPMTKMQSKFYSSIMVN
jgi:hypothetical protein